MRDSTRYLQMEKLLTVCLLVCAFLFVLFLIASGSGTVWLKILSALLIFLGCGFGLFSLYQSKEIFKSRSLWLSIGFSGVFLCSLVSLLLHYPG